MNAISIVGKILKSPVKATELLAVKNALPAKIIGGAGALACAYNVLVDGRIKSKQETEDELADHYVDIYERNLSSTRRSTLLEKVKNFVTRMRLDTPFYPFIHSVKNYVTSTADEIMENFVPIILSFTALRGTKLFSNPAVGKTVSVVSAGLLVLGAAKIFLHDVWGIGKSKE